MADAHAKHDAPDDAAAIAYRLCFQHGGYVRKQLMTVGANGVRAVIKQAPIITCFVRLDMTQQYGTADCCSGC